MPQIDYLWKLEVLFRILVLGDALILEGKNEAKGKWGTAQPVES